MFCNAWYNIFYAPFTSQVANGRLYHQLGKANRYHFITTGEQAINLCDQSLIGSKHHHWSDR